MNNNNCKIKPYLPVAAAARSTLRFCTYDEVCSMDSKIAPNGSEAAVARSTLNLCTHNAKVCSMGRRIVQIKKAMLKQQGNHLLSSAEIRSLNKLFNGFFEEYGGCFNISDLHRLEDLKQTFLHMKSKKWYSNVNMKNALERIDKIIKRLLAKKVVVERELQNFLQHQLPDVSNLIAEYDIQILNLSKFDVERMSLKKCREFGKRCLHYEDIDQEHVRNFFQYADEKQVNACFQGCTGEYEYFLKSENFELISENPEKMLCMLPLELEALDLSECGVLFGSPFLDSLSSREWNIKRLNLTNWTHAINVISDSYLKDIKRGCPHLKKLDISGSTKDISPEMLDQIEKGKFLPGVEVITKRPEAQEEQEEKGEIE